MACLWTSYLFRFGVYEQFGPYPVKYSHQVKLSEFSFNIIDRYKVPTVCPVCCHSSDAQRE